MSIKSIKKNHIIITALVAMIGVAGYLNYIDSSSGDVSQVMLTDEGDLAAVPDEVAVNDENPAIASDEAKAEATTMSTEGATEEAANPDAGTAVFVNSSNESNQEISKRICLMKCLTMKSWIQKRKMKLQLLCFKFSRELKKKLLLNL